MEADIHIISLLKLCGIEATEIADSNKVFKKIYGYPNPDGSTRWMWDAKSKQPLFLKFYGVIGWKSKLFAEFVSLLFQLRLQQIIAKKCTIIYLDDENNSTYQNFFGSEWALFTGTPGKLRKAVITIQKKSESIFLKVPLTEAAKKIVKIEANNLHALEKLELKSTIVPKGNFNQSSLQQTDLSQYCTSRSADFGNAHLISMNELFQKTGQVKKIVDTNFWATINSNINLLSRISAPSKIPIWNDLVKNLVDEKNKIDTSVSIPICLAHADLTAWNCYCDNAKLYMYDWELAINDASALYDLFHFHIQGNCLLGNQSFEIIDEKLTQVLDRNEIINFCELNKIDVQLHLKLYLLYHVSTSLCWYAEQHDLHLQVQWLTGLWNKYLLK